MDFINKIFRNNQAVGLINQAPTIKSGWHLIL